jgi:hypothetical protein
VASGNDVGSPAIEVIVTAGPWQPIEESEQELLDEERKKKHQPPANIPWEKQANDTRDSENHPGI